MFPSISDGGAFMAIGDEAGLIFLLEFYLRIDLED